MCGRRPRAPARWSLSAHTSIAPSPSTGCRPAEGPIFVASEHLPNTWGDTTQPLLHPSEPLGTKPPSPEAKPGSGLLNSPDISMGHCGQYPMEAPLSTQSKRQVQVKNQRVINGGEQDMMMSDNDGFTHITWVTAPLLHRGWGYNSILSA